MNGLNHFTKSEMMSGYVASKGVSSPKAAVYFSGMLLLIGGLGVVLGVYIKVAVLALILFLIPVSFKMHNYWKDTDPNMKMMNMVHFMKNMALLGAALMILVVPAPWSYAISF